ncbi:MAG TPA: hypothetical protein VNN18_11450 [Candidatus Xenobia bacterium]|nr:hypothetical protein [Candidatus Xenobia bacterium]
MSLLYLTVFHAVVGRRRRCRACGKEQVVGRLDKDSRYHCKHCGHRFSKQELQHFSGSR